MLSDPAYYLLGDGARIPREMVETQGLDRSDLVLIAVPRGQRDDWRVERRQFYVRVKDLARRERLMSEIMANAELCDDDDVDGL